MACADNVGHCKKGQCQVPDPKLEVTVEPCVSATASGLKPGTLCRFIVSGECFGSVVSDEPVSATGESLLVGACGGDCKQKCPDASFMSIKVTASGERAKSGKAVVLKKKVKHIACIGQ